MTATLDPNTIVVRDRQRKAITNVDDYFVKSVVTRLIHPIVVRREDDKPVLVVGGRRLEALKKGQVSPLVENIHFRFFDDLTPDEARIVELEENAKREDLPWRDQVAAIGQLHETFKSQNPKWDIQKTAERLNINKSQTYDFIKVYQNLDSPLLRDAANVRSAISILQISAERRVGQIADQFTEISRKLFAPPPPTPAPTPNIPPPNPSPVSPVGTGSPSPVRLNGGGPAPIIVPPPVPAPEPVPIPDVQRIILNEDFIKWAKTYEGRKFNLIHCDFPFDIRYDSYARSVTSTQEDYDFSGFWPLTDALVENIDRICSYTAHIMFWFSMKFYAETKARLEKISNLYVHEHPLIWLKSDNAGIIPGRDNQFARRIYETAFLCTRNKRPLVRSTANAYAAPTASNAIHPSQKPEPVLRFFLGAMVDETTDFLDPTAGSGTALRAAEDCKARTVIGLEIKKEYADMAEAACQNHRRMRNYKP